jgi:MATE family multidrug resistance protein
MLSGNITTTIARHWHGTIAGGITYGVLCALFLCCFSSLVAVVIYSDTTVVSMAATLLLYGALFQISDSTQAIGVGLLRGIKDVKRPTVYVAHCLLGDRDTGRLLARFKLQMGAAGICLAL